MTIKCPKCGAENPDHSFYCGRCASELPRTALVQEAGSAEQTPPATREKVLMARFDPRVATAIKARRDARIAAEREAASTKDQKDVQVSVAINIRRIALVLILIVILSIGSTLVGLAISVFFPDMSSAKAILTVWLVFAVLVMIVGLYIIIYKKRLTTF
jgi:hypothetical protein